MLYRLVDPSVADLIEQVMPGEIRSRPGILARESWASDGLSFDEGDPRAMTVDGTAPAWPRIATLAVRCVFTRIGRSRALSRPWSHSTRLFSYWPVLCHAAGTRSSIALANAGARSVITSPGSP